MLLTCNEIGELVTRIQTDFLENPDLRLTLEDTERRFHIDRLTCQALLDALADGHVLTLDATGRYRRRFSAGHHVFGNHRLTVSSGAAA